MTPVEHRTRELAERMSSGTHVRLLWRQGTKQLWIEIRGLRPTARSGFACSRSWRSMLSIIRMRTCRE
jgi:hypothetical protein